jgi:hypothetical protein
MDFVEVERKEEPIEGIKNIRELTPFEEKQKEYILSKYPQLDDFMIDTIVRMTEEQKNNIVAKMKSGELKHEEPKDAEHYIMKSVSVE